MTTVLTGTRGRRVHLWLLLITLLAFGLRLYAIDRQDLWGDEAFSVWMGRQPLSEIVAVGADTHPPLYLFSLHAWLRMAGSSPLAIRFLSVLFGTLTIPVVYALGRRTLGQTSGQLAALLMALSPVLVYYSQETRMYGLVTLLAAASLYWVVRIPDRPGGPWPYAAYLLVTIALVYTHYYALALVAAQNLVLLPFFVVRRRWPALRRWIALQAAVVLAYAPWIVAQSRFLGDRAGARFGEWNLSTALRIAGETARAVSAGLAVPATAAWVISGVFLAIVASGLFVLLSRRGLGAWLIAAHLLLPPFLAWIVHPIMPFFYPRYLLIIVPAFYLLAARGVLSLGRLGRPLAFGGALLLLAGSAYGLHGYYTDEAYVKGRYGQMMAHVEAHAQPGDGLILANQLQRPLYEYYQPPGIDAYFFPRYDYALEDPRTAADLEAIAAEHPRLWLVRFGNPAEYDPGGTLTRWLAMHGSKAYFEGWLDADLSLYVMQPAAEADDVQHPLRADLGGQVRLLGYALSAERLAPGDTLLLTLYWQALAPMERRYTVFTHLLDTEQHVVAQMDSEPQGGGLPTDRWTVGQVVQDNYALTLPQAARPGPHLLEVGMYYLPTLERLPVRDPDTGEPLGDRVLLGTVKVVAP